MARGATEKERTEGATLVEQLRRALAAVAGEERALELVRRTQVRLGLSEGDLTESDALLVIEELGQVPGVLGVVSRRLRSQLSAKTTIKPAATVSVAAPKTSSGSRISLLELCGLLSQSLGVDKSKEVVAQTLGKLHLRGEDFSKDEALAVLEELAGIPGLVGITARFAKPRLLLRESAK